MIELKSQLDDLKRKGFWDKQLAFASSVGSASFDRACVCYLFNGGLIVEIEEDSNGELVKAHGHFEFVLCCGNKHFCDIVEARKDD